MAARFFFLLLVLLLFFPAARAEQWEDILEEARGQTVYFNAWGGSGPVNEYIQWTSDQVKAQYGVTLIHVKVADVAEVVSRVLVEKTAGREEGGSVDLIWINGENFRTMKKNNLLFGPFSHLLPNYSLVDIENKKTTLFDFTEPVDHMESPWGMARLVFIYDSNRVNGHPRSMEELLKFAARHPGRFTYPGIPGFHGTTFIKQALLELVPEQSVLYRPVEEADFETCTRPLWDFLDKLHPLMWRKGTVFLESTSKMISLLNDGEIFISLSFNPNEAANAVASMELPESVRTYVHDDGTIGNTHFLAIAFNSSAWQGAMVTANFLLSPAAQARKADPKVWGDPTVLGMHHLLESEKELFDSIEMPAASLPAGEPAPVLQEPHVSWVKALEKAWLKRYHQ